MFVLRFGQVERKFRVSAIDDKVLRTSKLAAGVSGHAAHLTVDGVDSMVFESETPFKLAAFQDVLGPRCVVSKSDP